MAKLMKCTVCGGKVSSSAKTCPHCGAKNKKVDTTSNLENVSIKDWKILLLILIVTIVGVKYISSNTIEADREQRKVEDIKTEAQLKYEEKSRKTSNQNTDAEVAECRKAMDEYKKDGYSFVEKSTPSKYDYQTSMLKSYGVIFSCNGILSKSELESFDKHIKKMKGLCEILYKGCEV